MNSIKNRIFSLPQFAELAKYYNKKKIHLKNVQGSFNTFILEFIYWEKNTPVLYVANSLESAEKVHDDLEFLQREEETFSLKLFKRVFKNTAFK